MKLIKIVFINYVIIATFVFSIELFSGSILYLDKLFSKQEIEQNDDKGSFPDEINQMQMIDLTPILVHKPYKGKNFNVSIAGFRGGQTDFSIISDESQVLKVIPKSKKNTNVDMLFLGGSTTFGVGVSDRNTVPELFKDINKNKSVLNLGLGSNTSEGSLNILMEFKKNNFVVKNYIFLDGINEDWCYFTGYKDRNNSWINLKSVNNPYEKRYYTEILTLKIKRKYRFTNNLDAKNNIGHKRCAQRYIKHLRLVDEISKKFNVQPWVFLQPSAWTSDVGEFDFKKLNQGSRGKFYNNFYNEVIKLSKSFEFKNLKIIDIRSIFDDKIQNDKTIFIDVQHLTPYGNRIIAKKISDTILNN